MFRGKESSNRIELSRLVQDFEFWCFGLPATLGRGQWVLGVWEHLGAWGCPTCTHTHAHVYMYRIGGSGGQWVRSGQMTNN